MNSMKKHIAIVIMNVLILSLFSQTIIDKTGMYQCIEDEVNLWSQEHRYFTKFFEVKQLSTDSISISPLENMTLTANLKNDSLFFSYNETDIHNHNTTIKGKGCFYKDSISFSYSLSQTGYEGFFITNAGHKISTGLKELRNNQSMKCYPNIIKESFTLVGEIPITATKVQIELATMDGRVLSSTLLSERGAIKKQINMPPVNSGPYLVLVHCDGRVSSCLKIIKQ